MKSYTGSNTLISLLVKLKVILDKKANKTDLTEMRTDIDKKPEVFVEGTSLIIETK